MPNKAHLTAIGRTAVSVPVRLAIKAGLVTPKTESILDFGCGRGFDVDFLRREFPKAEVKGYDPHFSPLKDDWKFSVSALLWDTTVVFLNYVLNVIEDVNERDAALRAADSHASEVLIVAVRTDVIKGRPHGDGVKTSKGTFQKRFSDDEIRFILRQHLDGYQTGIVRLAKGIFAVIKMNDHIPSSILIKGVNDHLLMSGEKKLTRSEEHEVLDYLRGYASTFTEATQRVLHKRHPAVR